MKNQELQDKLRLAIKKELAKVTESNCPVIWERIHNKKGFLNQKGYQQIESMVIKKMIAGQLMPQAAIPQLEMELNDIS